MHGPAVIRTIIAARKHRHEHKAANQEGLVRAVLVAKNAGMSNEEIATVAGLSESTVRTMLKKGAGA